jgi:hypothetical protein
MAWRGKGVGDYLPTGNQGRDHHIQDLNDPKEELAVKN